MASDSRTDDAATRSLRQAVGKLLAGLWRAVFGVCAVAVGVLTLLLAAGSTTGESTSVFLIVGLAAILVGFATISRLPKPAKSAETADTITESDDTASDETAVDSNGADEPTDEETDRHRHRAD